MERRVLGGVKYLYDVTITHNDMDYMNKVCREEFRPTHAAHPCPRKYYETVYKPERNAPLSSATTAEEREEMSKNFEFAERNFRPLYYTMQYSEDRSKIEMSFDLTHYQPQFRGEQPAGPISPSDHTDHRNECQPPSEYTKRAQDAEKGKAGEEVRTGKDSDGRPEPPLDKHVFQTIFLDRDGSKDLWTWGDIREEKRICEKWWKQQSHRWQHYATVVPWMMFVNGKRNTQ